MRIREQTMQGVTFSLFSSSLTVKGQLRQISIPFPFVQWYNAMAIPFSKPLESRRPDLFRLFIGGILLIAPLLVLWGWWLFSVSISVYETGPPIWPTVPLFLRRGQTVRYVSRLIIPHRSGCRHAPPRMRRRYYPSQLSIVTRMIERHSPKDLSGTEEPYMKEQACTVVLLCAELTWRAAGSSSNGSITDRSLRKELRFFRMPSIS